LLSGIALGRRVSNAPCPLGAWPRHNQGRSQRLMPLPQRPSARRTVIAVSSNSRPNASALAVHNAIQCSADALRQRKTPFGIIESCIFTLLGICGSFDGRDRRACPPALATEIARGAMPTCLSAE
jgi:hypothetical protein